MPLIHAIELISATERQKLIAQYVAPDSHHPGIAQYCLRESGISIWALVAYYETVGNDRSRVARDYDISEEHVRAALAFYREHTESVDAYLASRMETVSDG